MRRPEVPAAFLNSATLFEIQAKRTHQYKHQHLNPIHRPVLVMLGAAVRSHVTVKASPAFVKIAFAGICGFQTAVRAQGEDDQHVTSDVQTECVTDGVFQCQLRGIATKTMSVPLTSTEPKLFLRTRTP